MNIIPEQLSSTGEIEFTFQESSKTKKDSLTPPSSKTQSKQLPERDSVQETNATKTTPPNADEVIEFLIEHDKTSKGGGISPEKLLNSLINECRSSEKAEIQEAVKNFDEAIGNLSRKTKGEVQIQKAFVVSSQNPPSASTRNLPQVKVSESVDRKINDEIRQPLFDAVKPLVLLQLGQTKAKIIEDAKNATDGSAFSQMAIGRTALRAEQMKYIALLSSIDREGTINLLQSDDGCKLLPSHLRNPNASPEENYGIFLKDLYSLTHQKDEKLLERYGGDGIEPLLKVMYSNLTLGRPLYKNGAREILSAQNSPYRLGKMELLKTFAEEVGRAYWLYNDEDETSAESNLKLFDEKDLKDRGLDEFEFIENPDPEYPEYSYISKDEKLGKLLHISLREVEEIDLADAKMLGLVTPENAKELEKKGIKTVTPMFIVPRWERDKQDTKFTAIPNIMGITPKALEHADKFTNEVRKKIEEKNEDRKSPYVPVCAAFCMGAMTAQAIAVKYNIPSLVFNPFNPDPGVLERFTKDNAIEKANDSEHTLCHQAYPMEGDYISHFKFLDSQVRADASKALLDPKRKAIKEELKEVAYYTKWLLTSEPEKTIQDFKDHVRWLSDDINKHFKNAFDKTNSLKVGLFAALKYKAENFFANKPAVIGQSYLLDAPLYIFEKPTDGERHISFPDAIANQPNFGGKKATKEENEGDLAGKMINVIKEDVSIKKQVISSIGQDTVNKLGEDKAIEQWVENSLMDYDPENGINIDTDKDVKLEIMKSAIQKMTLQIIEKYDDFKGQITTLTEESNTIEQWIEKNLKYEDIDQIRKASIYDIKLKILNVLDQNWRLIVNGVEEAINENLDIKDWITKNIKNGDIRHWVNENMKNSYKNKDFAASPKEDIQKWVVQQIIQNKAIQIVEQDEDLKKQITTLIGKNKTVGKWIEENLKYDNTDQMIKASDEGIKEKIADALKNDLNQNWKSIVNGIKNAIDKNTNVKDWITKNLENGNVDQWIKGSISNSYANKNRAKKSFSDVQAWITQTMVRNKVTRVIENNEDLKKQVTTLIGKDNDIEEWIEDSFDEMESVLKLDIRDDKAVKQAIVSMIQDWETIVNGVEEAINENLDIKDWVTKNIKNGDIRHWINENMDNSHENKNFAASSKEDIQKWVVQQIIQNKAIRIVEQDKGLKNQITTLIGKDNDIEEWIEDNLEYDDTNQMMKTSDKGIKEKILNVLDQNWQSIVNGVRDAIDQNTDVKVWIEKNLENGDIDQWVKNNVSNSYENKNRAKKFFSDICAWITTMVRYKVIQVIENNEDLKKQVTTLIGEDNTIEQWIEDNFINGDDEIGDVLELDIRDDGAVKQKITDMVNQNWKSIVNRIRKALNGNRNVKNWVTKNIENGDIDLWLKDNISNSYKNKTQAQTSLPKVRTWITQTMVRNKVTQVIENDKDLKEQITTFIGKNKTIDQWIKDNFVRNKMADRLNVNISSDEAIKQKILSIIKPSRP